jgi:predicted permease
MTTLFQDLRYGFRRLRQSPGFTIVAIITLALGIGANTAIFTLVDAVMLKPLPVANPNALYRLGDGDNCCVIGGNQGNWGIYSYALYKQLRDHTPEFSQMAAFQGGLQDVSVRRGGAEGPAEPFEGEFVSGNYFSTFGLQAFAGRMITPNDDKPGAPAVAVMSYRAWQQHYGGDPAVIGATFRINTVPYTIAGVAPAGFFGDQLRPNPPDFWLTLATEPALNGGGSILNHPGDHWLYIIGRLKPGAMPGKVQSEVTLELQQWLTSQPDISAHERYELTKQHIVVTPAPGGVANLAREATTGLRLLMVIAGLVLMIACANIANLLLARGASQRGETAVRMALGASRARLFRQIITESVLLAVLGGTAGVYVAYAGTRAILLVTFRGARFVPIDAAPSHAVLAFAFLLSLVTGIVFGVAPAWITTRSDPAEALRGAGRATRDRSSLPQKSLVIVQVALCAILLVGAGLLTESLRNLQNQNFGFQREGRLDVRVDPRLAGYKPDRLYGLYEQLEARLPQIPGVISASYSLYSPMRGDNWSMGISLEGHSPDERNGASWDRVGPHYFRTIGTRLLRGRTINESDTAASQRVAVVNQTFVRKFYPKTDPIGKHFGIGGADHAGDYEIVGVVEDAKYQDARAPAYSTFFLPFLQSVTDKSPAYNSMVINSNYLGDIVLHVAGKPESLENAVRSALAGIDPNLTVLSMWSFDEQLSQNFNQDTLVARLTELFGALALILACVGLYGVTAYSVAKRTGEIGIRVALGASRSSVLALVLRGALFQVSLGLAIGVPAALAGGRLLASQLYGVKSYDPLILMAAVVLLGACAALAGFVPARRAASIDPMQALRTE